MISIKVWVLTKRHSGHAPMLSANFLPALERLVLGEVGHGVVAFQRDFVGSQIILLDSARALLFQTVQLRRELSVGRSVGEALAICRRIYPEISRRGAQANRKNGDQESGCRERKASS